MNTVNRIVLAALLALASFAAPSANAAPITLVADTFITEHPSKGGINANGGSDTELFVITPGGFRTYSLLRFAIEPGTVFTGGATLELFCNSDFAGGVTGVGLHTVTSAWAENTVTWNSLGGAYSGTAFAQNETAVTPGQYARWTIPQSVLQGWANNPATNNGIALIPTGGRDSDFDSRETITGNAPRITALAVAVPEAVTLTLLLPALGAGSVMIVRRRR